MKFPEWFYYKHYFYTYSLLKGTIFKVLSLSRYALSPTMLPLLETLSEFVKYEAIKTGIYELWLWRSQNDFIICITYVLIAYWKRPPSKYSPWADMHLAQRYYHCWKHFQNSWGTSYQYHHYSILMSSMSWNLRPCRGEYMFGKSQKSFGAKSGEQGGCSISVIDFLAQKLLAWQWAPCELEKYHDREPNSQAKIQAFSTHNFK
jgi:hypothetical protein